MMRTKLLLGTAALALVVGAGAIAQSVHAPSRGTDEGRATAAKSYKSPRTQAERIADLKRQSAAKKKKGAREAGSVEPLPDPQAGQVVASPSQQSASQQPAPSQNEPARSNVRTVYPNQTGPQSPQNQPSPSSQAQRAPAADSTHQAQQNATPPQGSGATPPAQPNVNQAAQQPAASPASAAAPPQNDAAQTTPQTRPSAETAQRGSSGIVALDTQQQTQVGQAIAQHKVQPLAKVNFSIAIGTTVPRSVQLRALPADLATFVPQYRGYSYFVVEDEVVIVDPASSRIVTIVPYTATARAEATPRAAPPPAPRRTVTRHPPMQSKSVKLDTRDRDAVRTYLRDHRTSSAAIDVKRKPKVRERVERSVTVETRPEVVYEQAPRRSFFGLFGHRDGPGLFDPDED